MYLEITIFSYILKGTVPGGYNAERLTKLLNLCFFFFSCARKVAKIDKPHCVCLRPSAHTEEAGVPWTNFATICAVNLCRIKTRLI